jgi:hypothetical protein
MFDRVEPETRAFLKKILLTMGLGLSWMFAGVVVGLGKGLAFVDGRLTAGNIIFYAIMIIGLVALIIKYVKMWRTR